MCSSRSLLALIGLVALAACSTASGGFPADASVRAATDLPDHFFVGAPGAEGVSEPDPGGACRSPLVDPRDGTRLVLSRSSGGRGDYEVPAGRYGVGEQELLRVQCGTGRPAGAVRR